MLVIGGISLYRSFAMYKVEKTFNVLQGTVPDFSTSDIKLAITLDGKEVEDIPTKEAGKNYKVTVECDKGKGSWNYNKWQVEVKEFKKGTKCNVSFTTSTEGEVPLTPNANDFVIVPIEDLGIIKESNILSHKIPTYFSGSRTILNLDVSNYSYIYVYVSSVRIGDGMSVRLSIDNDVKANIEDYKYSEYDVSNSSVLTLSTYSSNGKSNPVGVISWTILAA